MLFCGKIRNSFKIEWYCAFSLCRCKKGCSTAPRCAILCNLLGLLEYLWIDVCQKPRTNTLQNGSTIMISVSLRFRLGARELVEDNKALSKWIYLIGSIYSIRFFAGDISSCCHTYVHRAIMMRDVKWQYITQIHHQTFTLIHSTFGALLFNSKPWIINKLCIALHFGVVFQMFFSLTHIYSSFTATYIIGYRIYAICTRFQPKEKLKMIEIRLEVDSRSDKNECLNNIFERSQEMSRRIGEYMIIFSQPVR